MLGQYFIENFYLLIILAGLACLLVDNFREKRKNTVYGIVILSCAFVLSIGNMLQRYGVENGYVFLATVFYYVGIVGRPVVLFFFILLGGGQDKVKPWVFLVILGANAVIYLSALFLTSDFLSHLTFYFVATSDGTLEIVTTGPLYFVSHAISVLALGYLLYISISKLNGKDYLEGASLLVCSIAVILAVVLGTLGIIRNMLNTTIAISCLFYYLFLTKQENKKDPLTGLYNRQTYYKDLAQYGKAIKAAIQIDMNGLKHINDTEGHQAGDNAIVSVAAAIERFKGRNAFAYRLGGDEFLVFLLKADKKSLSRFVEDVTESLSESHCLCAIGYALRENGESIDDLMRRAEEFMYARKGEFYQNAPFERRH